MSQYSFLILLLKDITRVISKGRDRIVEIGSSRLLSPCKLLI